MPQPIVLTTDAVPTKDRFEYWREIICAVYVKLDAEPTVDGDFSGSVAWSPWGEATISRVSSEGQTVTRHPDGGSDDCLLSVQVKGTGVVSQGGRTAVLAAGDSALYDARRPYQLSFDAAFDQVVIQFPREALIARNVHIESAVARPVSGVSGVGAVIGSMVQALGDSGADFDDRQRAELGRQVADITALALSTNPTSDSVAGFNRQRILTYVDDNLHDPALNVSAVARSFGVSARTVQKLFADDELQLAARIRTARLERARQALRSPQYAHRTIAAIATSNGFAGPTQFARAFRAAFGCSPSDVRRAPH